ncbi:MAG: hypothetical protein KDA24_05360 [Deltaproteobacteria bacterium]|nr:hypothetical protein [Deltaproteobacteria bacterium]
MQPKVVAGLMVLVLAILTMPILNLAERTRVQGEINDTLTLSNKHILKDRESLLKMLNDQVNDIVGEGANPEVILYQYRGSVPVQDLANPAKVPNTDGVVKRGSYYEVSALVARVFWVQTKLIGTVRDVDGYPVGSCYFCEDDARAQRVLFVDGQALGLAYTNPPGDLDFVQNPAILFD